MHPLDRCACQQDPITNYFTEYAQRSKPSILGDFLAGIVDNAPNSQTIVVHQNPAEYCTRERRRCLGCFNDRNNLVVLQNFGTIIVMTVLILEPVLLELNKIRTGHNSATNSALTAIAHWTAIHVICDATFVSMLESELPKSFVS